MYRMQSMMPRLLPGVLHRLPARDGVAVTIDDGPAAPDTASLLAVCAELDLTCTWFLSGRQVRAFPGAAAEIAAEGHEIGSHGYLHRSVLGLSAAALREDLRRAGDAIADATGQRPVLYRPPYGRILPRQLSQLHGLGFRTVLWSQLPGDWNDRIPAHVLHARLASVSGGDIVVLHDRARGRRTLVGHLRALHRVLLAKGLRTYSLLQFTGVR
jgi:peptidoglycan/xylan/chitin deacetylase (PgdA/CDA1 family)